MESIGGIDPNELTLLVLQAEMVAVSIVLHVFALFRIGTKVLALAVVGARRDWWEVRNSLREISKMTDKGERDDKEESEKPSRDA